MNEPKRRRQPRVETQDNKAQELANRIWAGQSISLPVQERLARVERGLQAQGFGMEGVTLP
jgi:hypothetical protein